MIDASRISFDFSEGLALVRSGDKSIVSDALEWDFDDIFTWE